MCRTRPATTPARPDDEVLRLRSQVSTLNSQNERLVRTLRDARSQIVTLKSEVDRLGQPPATYGSSSRPSPMARPTS